MNENEELEHDLQTDMLAPDFSCATHMQRWHGEGVALSAMTLTMT